ncbi:MAG: hypothetical protein HY695_17835 [Deltaproteobacteria bacterium]|nr:hypothetical protein [Deltaproteobacteria bacterium]
MHFEEPGTKLFQLANNVPELVLPEIVLSLAALKIESVDMAFGNIFGSNLFNIVILAVDDIFYTKGPILSHVSRNHLVSSAAAIAMTAVAAIALTYRASRKLLFFAWDSLTIVAVLCFRFVRSIHDAIVSPYL